LTLLIELVLEALLSMDVEVEDKQEVVLSVAHRLGVSKPLVAC
jgi:2-hydroxychromene-2-carboxylate isomerase